MAADSDPGQTALDKLEAAETISRFYAAVQRYDCYATDWELIAPLLADEIVYLTQNLKDPTPAPRAQFLEQFRKIHDVHAAEGRGSFYGLFAPAVAVDGDSATVFQHMAVCHWSKPGNENSSWFYGAVDARLVRGSDGTWRIASLDVSRNVRVEGRDPPIDAFHP